MESGWRSSVTGPEEEASSHELQEIGSGRGGCSCHLLTKSPKRKLVFTWPHPGKAVLLMLRTRASHFSAPPESLQRPTPDAPHPYNSRHHNRIPSSLSSPYLQFHSFPFSCSRTPYHPVKQFGFWSLTSVTTSLSGHRLSLNPILGSMMQVRQGDLNHPAIDFRGFYLGLLGFKNYK